MRDVYSMTVKEDAVAAAVSRRAWILDIDAFDANSANEQFVKADKELKGAYSSYREYNFETWKRGAGLSDDENCTWEKFLALDEKEGVNSNM